MHESLPKHEPKNISNKFSSKPTKYSLRIKFSSKCLIFSLYHLHLYGKSWNCFVRLSLTHHTTAQVKMNRSTHKLGTNYPTMKLITILKGVPSDHFPGFCRNLTMTMYGRLCVPFLGPTPTNQPTRLLASLAANAKMKDYNSGQCRRKHAHHRNIITGANVLL